MSQSPEGSAYLCNRNSTNHGCPRWRCLNHPKALLISATGSRGRFLHHARRKSQSPEGSAYLCNQLKQKQEECLACNRCLNHPKALLISATPAFRIIGRSRTSIPVSITRRLCLSLQL